MDTINDHFVKQLLRLLTNMRMFLFALSLFFPVLLYGQNTIVAKDFFSLMHGIDKLHAPYRKKRKLYKLRNEHRKQRITHEVANSFFKSDTLYVMICPDPSGEYEDGFEECLYSDNHFSRISAYYVKNETNLAWENFIRKEMDYIIQGKYEVTAEASDLWKRGYDLHFFIKLIHTKGNEFLYKMNTYYIYHKGNDINIYKKI